MAAVRRSLFGALIALLPHGAAAQEAALADYYHLLPPMPTIVGETEASRSFLLFGDTAVADYVDVAPRDGIDDRRGARLLALAERFSPIMRRNNFSVPLDFAALPGKDGATLHVDVWSNGRRVRGDTIRLRSVLTPPGLARGPNDTLLAELVARHHPLRRTAVIDPGDRSSVVMYLDFPGFDEKSWRAEYQQARPADSRIYAHPFIEESNDDPGRFRFVVQYWFFYPFNDGPNNHEGDWEHLNVVVSWPREGQSSSSDLLTDADVRAILDGTDAVVDSLDIAYVEYFFHESLVVLDYRAASESGVAGHPFEDADWLAEVVAQRRRHANGRLATHPIAYIGANPTGPDELFDVVPRFTYSYNRNPHGTYPAPGLWQHVGHMGSTERVQGPVVPDVRDDPSAEWHELIEDSAWLTFPAERIILVPDWEAVADIALHEPEVRERWAWLFLPIRFGFPIARSPGAGLVPHTDLGNIAPEGPAFQPTWNRLAQADARERYTPTVVRIALVSTTPWTGVQSGWGALNVPIFAAGLMPGYNVLLSQIMPWFTSALEILNMPPPRTYYRGALPARFSSISGGVTLDVGGDELTSVIPAPDAESEVAAGARARPSTFERESGVLRRVSLTLYDGRRLSVENTFDWGATAGTYQLADSTGAAGLVNARVEVRELRGGFRYAVLMRPSGAARVDGRAGYGWSRFASRDGVVRDGAFADGLPDAETGYLPTILPSEQWWPNTWWLGLAGEIFTPRDHWLGRTVGYGLRVESAIAFHRLEDEIENRRYARRLTSSVSLVLGW